MGGVFDQLGQPVEYLEDLDGFGAHHLSDSIGGLRKRRRSELLEHPSAGFATEEWVHDREGEGGILYISYTSDAG